MVRFCENHRLTSFDPSDSQTAKILSGNVKCERESFWRLALDVERSVLNHLFVWTLTFSAFQRSALLK